MKICVVFNLAREEQVKDEKGPIVFAVFLFKHLTTDMEGWQQHIFCFLNGITQDFKWHSYRGLLSWGKSEGQRFLAVTPQLTTYYLWPFSPLERLLDWIWQQKTQLLKEIGNDISWLRRKNGDH